MQLHSPNLTLFRSRTQPQTPAKRPLGARWGCSSPSLTPLATPLLGNSACASSSSGRAISRTAGLRAKNHLSSQYQHVPLRLPPWWNSGVAGALLSAKRNAATVGSDAPEHQHTWGEGGRGWGSSRGDGKGEEEQGHAQHKGRRDKHAMDSSEMDDDEEEEGEEEEGEDEEEGHHGLHHAANTAFQFSYKSDSSSLDTVEEDVPLFSWPQGDMDGPSNGSAGASLSPHAFAKSNYAVSAEQGSGSSSSNLPKAYALPADTLKHQVLRLEPDGKTRRFYVRRRDLLREHKLQPRDLRRIDPAIDFTKTSPSITVKENALLLCLGGVR